MKATLTFDLDSPEEIAAHLRCTKALDLTLCLNEFRTQLFAKLKYDGLMRREKLMLSDISKLLDETLEEYGINLTELCR